MSSYSRMYAVPKEKYDAFIAGACKGDIKYTRQINQLDVNDGGKVIIRNDDHIKNSAVSREKPPPQRKKPTFGQNIDPQNNSRKKKNDSDDSSSSSGDFLAGVDERIENLRRRYLSSKPDRDGNAGQPNFSEGGDVSFKEQENPFIPPENNSFSGPIQNEDFENLTNPPSPPSQMRKPPSFEKSEKKSESPPLQIPRPLFSMPVTSDNPPRVFTPMNDLYSNNQLSGISQVLNQGGVNLRPLDVPGSINSINLNAIPDDVFRQSPIHDLNDILKLVGWNSNTNNLQNDIFDVSMEDLSPELAAPSITRKKDYLSSKHSSDGIFKRSGSKATRDRRAALHRKIMNQTSRPLRSQISFDNLENQNTSRIPNSAFDNLENQDTSLVPFIPNSALNSSDQAMDSFIRNSTDSPDHAMAGLPEGMDDDVPRGSIKPRKFAEKKPLTERQLARVLRQNRFNERRGPRRGEDFDDIASLIAKYPPLPPIHSFIPPAPIPTAQTFEPMTSFHVANEPSQLQLNYSPPMSDLVRRQKALDLQRRRSRTEKQSAYDERRGPRKSEVSNESNEDNFALMPYSSPRETRSKSAQITNSAKLRVKIGEPQDEIVSIVGQRKSSPSVSITKKKSDRKRDHSPELQVRFSKNKNPEKRKKDREINDDDGEYKEWGV